MEEVSSGSRKDRSISVSGTAAAITRHQNLMAIYSTSGKSDRAVLESNHQFIRDDTEDSLHNGSDNWGMRMARKYYAKLFKEYAIVDLSMHTTGKIGLRWRTEREVIAGRGQFTCASKHCNSENNLHSYEVPFDYSENNVKKSELVKVRVCIDCARKLFYDKLKSMRHEHRQRRRSSSDDASDGKTEDLSMTHDEILRELFNCEGKAECKELQTSSKRARSPS